MPARAVIGADGATSAVAASVGAPKLPLVPVVQTRVDVNAAQIDGTTALHWTAYHDDAETAALLVRAGANVNAVNRYGVPPLSVACSNGSGGVVKLLLAAGADANATMKGGETVLMMAARSGNLEAVNALLARGARPDARERRLFALRLGDRRLSLGDRRTQSLGRFLGGDRVDCYAGAELDACLNGQARHDFDMPVRTGVEPRVPRQRSLDRA